MGKALIIKGANFSQVAVDTIDIVVEAPTISITIAGVVSITGGMGDIYYTTDGSAPTSQSTKYIGSFNVQPNTTVKAVCYFGGNYSDVISQLYDGTLQAPTISITPRGVVTITATNNASIRYTVNGADPTTSTGTLYSGEFNVENGDVVKAIAYIDGTQVVSQVSSSEAIVVEGMHLNKYLANLASLEEQDETTDKNRCVSPYIDTYDGDANLTKDLVKVVYNIGSIVAGDYASFCCVATADKETCSDFWGIKGGTSRTMEGATESGFGRYFKGTFRQGETGFFEVYHRETASSEYALVGKWEYNGGSTDETATWTRTYPAQS